MEEYVKRFYTKDKKKRVTIVQYEYAENPRNNTDEPLHCEDWSREYSIMSKQDRESNSSSARSLLEYMIRYYGDYKKVIDFLVENGKHMTDGYCNSNDALVYNKSEHRWDLMSDMLHYNRETRKNEMGWCLNNHYYEKKYYIDLCGLLDDVCDSTIDYLAQNFLGDKVKIMSYGFGYNGDISFYHEFSTKSEGICWLEKNEFLKYSGNNESYWNGKTLDEIEFLLGELEAWSNNEVYGFTTEKAVSKIVNTRYPNGEHDDTEEQTTDWEETDSCYGYYGSLDKSLEWMLEDAGFKKEELEEEDV